MEIEELPDLKISWYRYDEYLNVPLLEYVWKVANHFVSPDGDISAAPAKFSNRYFESKLNAQERLERAIEMGMTKASLQGFMEPRYRKLDASFKERFLNNEDLQNTIEAFGLDISKLWYLLLFVYDYIEDFATNAPVVGKTMIEELNEFEIKLKEATSITLKKDNRKSYATEREDITKFIKASFEYYTNTYNNIVSADCPIEDKLKKLKDIGLDYFVDECSLPIDFENKTTLEITYKKWWFAKMFQFFLQDMKADRNRVRDKRVKVSTDKLMLISRLIYTVGYDSKRYNEEYDSEGNKNRMLSNLLRKYGKEEFPATTGHCYMW